MAVVKDRNHIGKLHGRQTVGDGHSAFTGDQIVELSMDFVLRYEIQCCCGLVKNESFSTAIQRPRYFEPLILAAGGCNAPLDQFLFRSVFLCPLSAHLSTVEYRNSCMLCEILP